MTGMQPKLTTPWSLSDSDAAEGTAAERWEGMTVPTPWPASYGGDLCVGALSAVMRSAEVGQRPHTLHVAFLRPGDSDAAVSYAVERVRDGFRYGNRAVRLSQDGTEVATATASVRKPRQGEEVHSPETPFGGDPLPAPDSLPTAAEAIVQRAPLASEHPDAARLDEYWAADRALDTRHIDPPLYGEQVAPRTWNRLWVRFTADAAEQRELLGTPNGRAALVAYLADDTILEPAIASLGHGWLTPNLFSTTVEQNVWFHADFDASDWLLFSQRLVSRAGDHVVCRGELFTPAGTLVATVLQEGIVRVRPPAA